MITIVEIKGEFDKNKIFNASPWYVYEAPLSKLKQRLNGEYAVHIYNSEGKRLAVTYFDAVNNYRSIGSKHYDKAEMRIPVQLFVKFDTQASKIVIFRGDVEIYSRNVSSKPPEVKFTGLTENQTISGKMSITWEASGSETGELFYKLWYYPRETESYTLAYDIEESFYRVDMTDYPGTNGGFFLIHATDGVRTVEVKSPLINKPFKAPEIITGQSDIPTVKVTEGITFYTRIFDAQDGQMSGSNVSWMLDGIEVSSTNVLKTQPYQLTPGQYTFICEATNSAGISARKAFTFEIISN